MTRLRPPLIALGYLLGLILLAAIAAGIVLRTATGMAWLAAGLSQVLSTPDRQVNVRGLHGLLPLDIRVEQIELADAAGVLARIEGAVLEIDGSELMRRRLVVRRARADLVALERLPSSAETGTGDTQLPGRMTLPVDAIVREIVIDRLSLSQAIAGEAVALELRGDLRLTARETALRAAIGRVDGVPGRADLHIGLAGDPVRLALDAVVEEPTGQLLQRLLGRDDRPDLAVEVKGDGPLSAWRGTVLARAGRLAAIEAEVEIAGADGYRLSLRGSARQDGLLPAALQQVVGDRTTFAARADWTGGGVILVDRADVSAGGLTLTGSGRLDQSTGAIEGRAELSVPDLATASALLGVPIAGAARVDATLEGTLRRPDLRLILAGRRMRIGEVGAEQADADLTVEVGTAERNGLWIVDGSGRLIDLELPAGDATLKLPGITEVAFRSAADPGANLLLIERFAVTGNALGIAGSGVLSPSGSNGQVQITLAELARFGPLAGLPALRGAARVNAELAFDPALAGSVTFDGALTAFDTGIAGASAAIGHDIEVAGTLGRASDGSLRASGLSLRATDLAITADATLGKDRRVDGVATVKVQRLRRIGAAYGVTVDGNLAATLRATGTLEHPAVSARIEGKAMPYADRIDTTISVADMARPKGKLTASLDHAGIAARVATDFAMTTVGQLRLANIALEAAGARIGGELAVALSTARATGRLAGHVPDLRPFSGLVRTPLGGQADLELKLADRGSRQQADIALRSSDVILGAGTEALAIRAVRVDGNLSALGADGKGAVEAEIRDARLGSVVLARTNLKARLESFAAVRFDAATEGTLVQTPQAPAQPLRLALTGQLVRSADRQSVTVDKLTGSLAGSGLSLRRPLRVALTPDSARFDGVDLTIGPGRIAGAVAIGDKAIEARVTGDRLPLNLLARIGGRPEVAGALQLNVDLTGSPVALEGRVTIEAGDLVLPGIGGGSPVPATLRVELAPAGSNLRLAARIDARERTLLKVDGAIPLRIGPRAYDIAIPADRPATLKAEGEGNLEWLAEFLPLGEDRLSGRYQLLLTANGSIFRPQLDGHLTVKDGLYRNRDYGTELRDINLDVRAERDVLRVVSMTATDGATGQAEASGQVQLDVAQQPKFDLRLGLRDFRVARSDLAKVEVAGDVRLSGGLEMPTLAARLTVLRGEFAIPDRLPSSVAELDVVRVDASRRRERPGPVATRPGASTDAPIALDIEVEMPNRLFVRGRGLDSEWQGRLLVAGTSVAPDVSGGIEVVRGTLALLGKTFTVSKGSIGFAGGSPADPLLDVTAQLRTAGITASVRLTGRPTSLAVELGSDPALPKDDILARVLFGRDIRRITPAQGLQLAYAASTLASGGPGVVDRLRSSIGLDRLDLGVSERDGEPGGIGAATVGAGKYVADGVFVGVDQGLTPGSTRAKVEIELTPSITARSSVGASSGSEVGIDWQYDY